MNFDLDENQLSILAGLATITAAHHEVPIRHNREPSYYAHDLDALLEQGGYFDILRMDEAGPLEAALVVQHLAKLPVVVEAGTSILVAPTLPDDALPRPFAVLSAPFDRAQRLLNVARTGLFVRNDRLYAIPIDGVVPVETIVAYPYGRFTASLDLSTARELGGPELVKTFDRRHRLALAAEISGALTSATDFTVQYVKDRYVFGKPIGQHQAVQHRLAQCHQAARALEFLLLRAAWLDDELQVRYALTFAQQHLSKAIFDLHQFNGAMGITLEHRLHCWTFRLVALQAELGGSSSVGAEVADRLWGSDEPAVHPRESRRG